MTDTPVSDTPVSDTPVSDTPVSDTPALSLRNLSVTFATDAEPVRAVRAVSFDVRRGEVLAVVGESGSGKSVSVRTAIGLLPDTALVEGTVLLDGRDVGTLDERAWTSLRGRAVSMIFQEPGSALDPLFTVGYQICEALRAHPRADGQRMNRADARARAIELLTLVGLPDPERRVDYYPHELSGGQKQRVMIAIAVSCEAQLIIADEPTTALDVTVQAEILALLRDLKDRLGCSIVLITHNMGVVKEIADRVVVMKDGEVVEEATVENLFAAPTAGYTRALLSAVLTLDSQAPSASAPPAGDPVVRVRELVVEFPGGIGRPPFRAVDAVSFDLAPGETLGLVGESGSGKSTVGRVVAALQRPSAGTVEVLGTDLAGVRGPALKALRRRFGFVFQDPSTALNPRLTVGQCVAEPLLVHQPSRFGRREPGQVRRTRADIDTAVTDLLEAVRLPATAAARYPHELSGGQRQRASLARALILRPDLLVADEPTSALDVSVQAAVLDLFEDLQAELGFACLFISHDLAVVDRLAHRVAVMRAGAVVELGTPADILRRPEHEYTRALIAAIPG